MMERKSDIIIFTFFLIALFSAVYFAVGNIELMKRVRERDQYIESFIQGDSTIVRERVEKEVVFHVGTQEMKADEFVDYVNNLRFAYLSKIDSLEDSLYYYRQFYNLVQRDFDIHFYIEPSEDSATVALSVSYPQGFKELEELKQSQFLLDAVIKKYSISIEEKEGYVLITSATLDSAMALLPYYRDRIKLSEDGKNWLIEIR